MTSRREVAQLMLLDFMTGSARFDRIANMGNAGHQVENMLFKIIIILQLITSRAQFAFSTSQDDCCIFILKLKSWWDDLQYLQFLYYEKIQCFVYPMEIVRGLIYHKIQGIFNNRRIYQCY